MESKTNHPLVSRVIDVIFDFENAFENGGYYTDKKYFLVNFEWLLINKLVLTQSINYRFHIVLNLQKMLLFKDVLCNISYIQTTHAGYHQQ